jgi:hypothetical protein
VVCDVRVFMCGGVKMRCKVVSKSGCGDDREKRIAYLRSAWHGESAGMRCVGCLQFLVGVRGGKVTFLTLDVSFSHFSLIYAREHNSPRGWSFCAVSSQVQCG